MCFHSYCFFSFIIDFIQTAKNQQTSYSLFSALSYEKYKLSRADVDIAYIIIKSCVLLH